VIFTYKKPDSKNDEVVMEAISFGGTNLYSNADNKLSGLSIFYHLCLKACCLLPRVSFVKLKYPFL